MGNIPLASILFTSGVSFAGVMAFIFSGLVVFPVLRISSQYFGWRMAVYILGVFLVCLVATSLLLHTGFALAGALPDAGVVQGARTESSERFQVDYTFFLNLGFLLVSTAMGVLATRRSAASSHVGERSWMNTLLLVLATASLVWLGGGLVLHIGR